MNLIALILAFPIAAAIGVLLVRDDAPFMQGLKGVLLAAVATVVLLFFVANHVVLSPAIEEAARLFLIAKSAFLLSGPRAWWLFGLGFGLPEGVSKILQVLVAAASNGELTMLSVLGPVVPVLMHIALSVVACTLIRIGWHWAVVLGLTFSVHFLHNWSLFNMTAGVPVDVALSRFVLFAMVIAGTLSWARRFTTPPPHANTPAHD